MAEQNPPGSRPGRPFVPPSRRPAAGEPAAPTPPGAASGTSAPRPFVPPAARPGGPSSPAQPRPAVPVTRPRTPAAPPEPAVRDELAVEHAISETIGQGAHATDAFGLEVERASEPASGALPGAVDAGPAPSELTFLSTLEEAPAAAAEPTPSATVDAVEDALAFERRSERANERALPDESAEEPPTSDEPLPWLAVPPEAPNRSAPLVAHEIKTPTFLIAGGYDMEEMRRPATEEKPSESETAAASAESSTIVGANLAVAGALESVARRVRGGEIRVPAIEPKTGDAGALTAVLAVLLGVRS
jgi:hypothetical protein